MDFKNVKNKGFTLIEMLIVLALMSVMFAFALPSFSNLAKGNRIATQFNMLMSSLTFARSEAIKRNTPVTVCRSNDQVSCSGLWQDGWIVFIDNGVLGTVNAPNDTILNVHGALTIGSTLSYAVINKVTYLASGVIAAGDNGTFSFCDSRSGNFGIQIIITPTGRTRKRSDAACP